MSELADATDRVIGIGGAAIAVVAIAVAIVIYFKQKQTKTLDWEASYLASILADVKGNVSKLRVTWEDHELTEPFLCRLQIQNSGSEPIKADEYLHPLTMDFGSTRVYNVSVTDDAKIGISSPNIELPASEIIFQTPTMNSNDSFTVEFLADGPATYPRITSRIIGQTRATSNVLLRDFARVKRRNRLFGLIFVCIVLPLVGIGFATPNSSQNIEFQRLILAGVGIIVVLGTFALSAAARIDAVRMRRVQDQSRFRPQDFV